MNRRFGVLVLAVLFWAASGTAAQAEGGWGADPPFPIAPPEVIP